MPNITAQKMIYHKVIFARRSGFRRFSSSKRLSCEGIMK